MKLLKKKELRPVGAKKDSRLKMQTRRAAQLVFAIAVSALFSVRADAVDGDLDPEIISWPESNWQYSQLRAHKTPADDEPGKYFLHATHSFLVLRARNLVGSDHFEEAYRDYQVVLSRKDLDYSSFEHGEFAFVCDRLGKTDEAIKHARLAGDSQLLVKNLLKKGLFKEALDIANRNIEHEDSDTLAPPDYFHTNAERWLRIRARIKLQMKDYAGAVIDLKSSASKYYVYDTVEAEECARLANLIIDATGLGSKFQLSSDCFPTKNREKVIALIEHLGKSPDPLSSTLINKAIGSRISIPGKSWKNTFEDYDFLPFRLIEYRTFDEDILKPELLYAIVSSDDCCVTKEEILKLIPEGTLKTNARVRLAHFGQENSDTWQLPTGRLHLEFGTSGAQVLRTIKFDAPDLDAVAALTEAEDNSDSNPIAALDKKLMSDPENLSLLLERAEKLVYAKQLERALSDFKKVVSIGGRFYLYQKSKVEAEMGDFRSAEKDLEGFIGARKPGPETCQLFADLAELQLQTDDVQGAQESLKKAKCGSINLQPILFLEAKIALANGRNELARELANRAQKYYFDNAKIVMRDRVAKFIKSIPPNPAEKR